MRSTPVFGFRSRAEQKNGLRMAELAAPSVFLRIATAFATVAPWLGKSGDEPTRTPFLRMNGLVRSTLDGGGSVNSKLACSSAARVHRSFSPGQLLYRILTYSVHHFTALASNVGPHDCKPNSSSNTHTCKLNTLTTISRFKPSHFEVSLGALGHWDRASAVAIRSQWDVCCRA